MVFHLLGTAQGTEELLFFGKRIHASHMICYYRGSIFSKCGYLTTGARVQHLKVQSVPNEVLPISEEGT
mgnify:CR=1 FL=1